MYLDAFRRFTRVFDCLQVSLTSAEDLEGRQVASWIRHVSLCISAILLRCALACARLTVLDGACHVFLCLETRVTGLRRLRPVCGLWVRMTRVGIGLRVLASGNNCLQEFKVSSGGLRLLTLSSCV